MPNYKIFQDFPDSLRVKIYGSDSTGTLNSLRTDTSGRLDVFSDSGTPVYVAQASGTVFNVSGDLNVTITSGDVITVVNTSGNALYVRTVSGDPLVVSGYAFNSSGDPLYVRTVSGDTIATSGYAFNSSGDPLYVRTVSGDTIATSGYAFNSSGDPLYVRTVSGDTIATSGYAFNSSGAPLYVVSTSGNPSYVELHSVNTTFSGPVTTAVTAGGSGAVGGNEWPVLGYNSPSFVVKYSGVSGAQVRIRMQDAAVSGDANYFNDDGTYNFSGTTWQVLSPTYKLRFSRVYYAFSGTVGGDLLLYFQSEL
jgi:hypothetical protein